MREALRFGAQALAAAGIENPRLEARLLLAHATGMAPEALLGARGLPQRPPGYADLLARRAQRHPLAHILGRREFWSLSFAVSPATLIPRPESETLVEAALATVADRSRPYRVLDLGTGTGCLLLALLSELPHAFGVGTDYVSDAAVLAARNAAMLGLQSRAAFACGDWAEPLSGRFDIVLCNPPYVPSAEIAGLMPEVARHEPQTALDGGVDGLAAYRRVIPAIHELLTAAGVAVLEIGEGAAVAVAELATAAGLTTLCREDLAGIPRAMTLSLR